MKLDTSDFYGWTIQDAAAELRKRADEHGEACEMEFNGLRVVVEPGEDRAEAVRRYDRDWQARSDEHWRKREEYEQTPAGRAEKERAEAKERERQAKLAAEGGKPCDFAKSDAAAWESWLAANKEDYGACICRYAARWAHYMEQRIAAGATVADCAEQASHEADLEGITGFMYGAAVAMLAKCWTRGEELRRWHNLETQVRDEGEKANESGGVLNPALLRLG